jgi:hypothetical protein
VLLNYSKSIFQPLESSIYALKMEKSSVLKRTSSSVAAFLAATIFVGALQYISFATAPSASAAPASTSVAGNIASGGLEFNSGRYKLGTSLPTGYFNVQMWVQLNTEDGNPVADGASNTYNYLMGGDSCNDFGIHSNNNELQGQVRKSVWVIDYVCYAQHFFYCEPLVTQTWYGIVIAQSSTGFTMWMNGQRCSTNFDGSGTGYRSYVNFGQPDYVGGSNGQPAARWGISNFRWENFTRYDVTQSTITPATFPLAQTANTSMLLNSNVPENTTDATGYITLTKQGSGSIIAAPAFLTPQSINLSSSATSLSYGQTATLTPSGFSGTGARTYNTSGGCTVSGNTLTAGSSGTCSVSVTIAADTTYKTATSSTISITQSKAAQATFTASQVTSSATWNGSAFTATPSFSTIGGSDTGAVTYAVSNGTATGCSLSNATASAVLTASTAGTCTITATKAATTNYNAATSTLAFTFSQLSTTSNLAISNTSVTYGGALTLTASVSPSTATGTFSFSNNGTPISGCTAAPISAGAATCTTWKPAVGTYTPLTATYSGTTNVLTSVSSNSISLQITRAPLTVTASSPTVFFGSAIPLITPSYSGFVNSETSAVVSGISCSTAYTTSSAVGSLPSTSCSGGSASNYQISYTNGAVNINQASSTISLALTAGATTATYGTSVIITATVNTPGAVTFKSGGTAITGCTSVTATTTATCSWTPSAFNTNTVLTADFLPTDSTNYSNLTSAGSLTINVGKAVLSITASSHSVAYGAAVPIITPTFSGFVNGDTSAVLLTQPTCSTTYTTSTSPGNVASNCSGAAAANYSFSYSAGVITIGKAAQATLVGTAGQSMWAWTVLPFSSIETTGGDGTGAVKFAVASGPCAISGTTLTATTGGTCSLIATKEADTNYLEISSVAFSFTVAKGTPTVSQSLPASATTATYGLAVVITATVQYAGTVTFKAGTTEICNTVTANLTATCSWTPNSAVSTILTIDYVPTNTNWYNSRTGVGSLTITVGKATPTFSNFANVSKTYGAASFSLTTPTSSTPGDWIYSSATTSVASINGSTATIAGFGTSLVTATFTPTDSSNYFSNGTTTMTISVSKALLSITASSHTAAFGDAVPAITPTYSGFVNGEDSTVLLTTPICSTTYTTTTAVGTVGSSCSGATAANYSFSYTAGVITITQGGQTSVLVITTTTVIYGTTLSLVTSGGNGGGANSFVVNSGPCSVLDSTLTSTAVGTCMVTATKAANGNYLAASSTSTAITVTPKGLTVSGLTGVNKEFDLSLTGTVTGSPTLVGVVGSDNVLLLGTPVFTFASANTGNGITLTASGYTLTGTTASNYTLTQPTLTANITAKAARVAATNITVAFGAPVTSGVTVSGLISPDAVGSASYTYTGTGTSTPPTAVGVYTVTPSNAVFGTGSIGNYTIAYDTATLTILAKYTITYNANGGVIGSISTTSADFVVGDTALALPTPTREGFNFLGWFTLQSNGVQVTGAYTPSATATLWAHWIQKSLVGVGNSQKIGTITTLANVGNTYSATSTGGTVAVTYVANALPVGTVIDIYQMADSSRASSMISSADQYVLSLVIAWLTPTNTVPVLSSNDALTMVITDSAIKKGAKVYSLVGNDSTLLGTATADGSVTVKILEDPEVYIAISKPDAPTGVTATTGGSKSSTVSWIVPSTDGGSTIDLYTVTSNRGQTCTTVTTSCSVTGLSDATTYTFTVTARNSVGTSASSAPSAAILTEDTAGLALAAQQAADARVAAAAVVAQQAAAALAAQQAAAALAAQQAAIAPAPAAALVSTPVVMITPTLTSLTFVENATKDGGKLVWTGTDIESVLFTGVASTYPQPFNYGAFTLTWTGELVNMVAGVTYTMKIEARSSTGGSASKTIEYTIAKPVVDTTTADASLKEAQEKAVAEKKAAEEAAAVALKIAQDKALAEAKAAADAAALKVAQDKTAAEAKAAADAAALKIALEKAAAEVEAATEAKAAADAAALKVAQEKAAAEVKAVEEAAALKIVQEKAAAAALAIAKKTPVLNLFSSYSTAKYTSTQMAKMKKLTLKLEPATTLKCVGYINTKGTTATKAKATALAQAKATCASAKKLNPKITTVVTTAAVTKAPKPLVGASNTKAKYRVDLFAYKG